MSDAATLAAEVADHLRGTCLSLQQGILSVHGDDAIELENDLDFCAALDDRAFCCEQCGWWCGTEEASADTASGFVCDGCEPGEDE